MDASYHDNDLRKGSQRENLESRNGSGDTTIPEIMYKEKIMKLLGICIIVLIPVIAGCQHGNTYFYHPDKTIEQAKVDCETCHEPLIRATVGGTITPSTSDYIESLDLAGDECMKRLGYSILPGSKLPSGVSTLAVHRNLFNHKMAGK